MPLNNDPPAGVWHRLTVDGAAEALSSDPSSGLSSKEASRRLELYGPNELPDPGKRSSFQIFLGQFNDFMIWVLIVAAFVSGVFLREIIDAIAIGAILVLNAALGFVQEMRAEAAIESLKALSAPQALVVRDGRELVIPASDLVPGDLVVLAAGDVVPADCRLVDVAALQVNEAALTGESLSVHKDTGPIDLEQIPLGDRKNLLYLGTTVETGRGRGFVVATGSATEMGKIAELVGGGDEPTPLQIELKRVGRNIAIIVLVVAAIVFAAGIVTGKPAALMFLAAVALAVAAIPEGLPAIVTVTLSLGVRTMASIQAIIRRLHAVETLGATTFIATDKTGTLTENRMAVTIAAVDGRLVPAGEFTSGDVGVARLFKAAALVNDAYGRDGRIVGDPTEVALVEAAVGVGIEKESLEATMPRIDEVPFDSARKLMTTLHADGGGFVAYAKGAPEVLLERCALSDEERAEYRKIVERLGGEGLRSLAVAERRLTIKPENLQAEEREFTCLGILALQDPPRAGVAEAIDTCRRAGIKVAMVTGDHAATAAAIGRFIGLGEGSALMTGAELEATSTEDLVKALDRVSIFARVDPAHKLDIVEALKDRGEIVAMTGDGVNDAPALKKADIGVAMGIVGTDVAKEASDMVLADDNFTTIVAAVRQGRLVFDNLRKFIHFLLSCNMSEVLTMFAVTIAGLPLPLFPVQLLWINLITDGLPALALGVDPPEGDLMLRPPRDPKDSIVAPRALKRPMLWGLFLAVGSVGAFVSILLLNGVPLAEASDARFAVIVATAQTTAFTALVLQQLVHALSFRSYRTSIFSAESVKNKLLLLAIAGSVLLQLLVVYVPGINRIFRAEPLGTTEWLVIAIAVVVPTVLVDISKRLMWRK